MLRKAVLGTVMLLCAMSALIAFAGARAVHPAHGSSQSAHRVGAAHRSKHRHRSRKHRQRSRKHRQRARSAPVNRHRPSIFGRAAVGDRLTSNKGSWSGRPARYGYQWKDCNRNGSGCKSISGATSSSYRVTSGDVGSRLVLTVTAYAPKAKPSHVRVVPHIARLRPIVGQAQHRRRPRFCRRPPRLTQPSRWRR